MCTLNKDGLVVAKNTDKSQPFQTNKTSRIVIPREFAYSYTVILHRKFAHPLPSQMLKLFNRNFFMLDAAEVIKEVTNNCDFPCQAMKAVPKETLQFTTETKPPSAGSFFNADVLVESGQKILVIREHLTSYTDALIIPNEQKPTLRDHLIILSSKLRSNSPITIRVDPQSSFKALRSDRILAEEEITLEIGSSKNINKNAVAEKGIGELRNELVRASPGGGPYSAKTLAKALFNLNNRIRHTGRSARELWVRRDQTSSQGLDFQDEDISNLQSSMRTSSHPTSAKHKSNGAPKVVLPTVKVGDRIFIKSDKSKNRARDQYVVLSHVPNKPDITVQKLGEGNNRSNVLTVQLQNIYKLPSPPSPRVEAVQPDEEHHSDFGEEHPVLQHGGDDVKDHINNNANTSTDLPTCFFCINMRRPEISHDDSDCKYLQEIKSTKLSHLPLASDSSDDEYDTQRPTPEPQLAEPPDPPHPFPQAVSPAPEMNDDDLVLVEPTLLATPTENTPERPRRIRKPPSRYSPSPQERRRRQSVARNAPKTRTPDKARTDLRTQAGGRTWDTPTVPEEDSSDDSTFEIIFEHQN